MQESLYTKSFYLAKSKLRTLSSVDMLSLLVDNNKYGNILSYLRTHTSAVASPSGLRPQKPAPECR